MTQSVWAVSLSSLGFKEDLCSHRWYHTEIHKGFTRTNCAVWQANKDNLHHRLNYLKIIFFTNDRSLKHKQADKHKPVIMWNYWWLGIWHEIYLKRCFSSNLQAFAEKWNCNHRDSCRLSPKREFIKARSHHSCHKINLSNTRSSSQCSSLGWAAFISSGRMNVPQEPIRLTGTNGCQPENLSFSESLPSLLAASLTWYSTPLILFIFID